MTSLFGTDPSEDLVREAAWVARCVGRADLVPLSEADLVALASYISPRQVERSRVLFPEGKPQVGVWIVRTGTVELAAGSGRRRAIVFLLRPGDVEGDIALILNKPPPYTARAVEDTQCLFLDIQSFDRLLLEHPAVARRWLSSTAARIDRSQARILQLLGRSLPEQVAKLLLDEAVDGIVSLPQRTLAAMLGAHRPSVNKVLKDFEAAALLEVGYVEVKVIDPPRLERIAAGGARR